MKIKSTWARLFESFNNTLVLFNNYPEICQKANAYDDEPLLRACEDDDVEVSQWYIVDLNDLDIKYLEKITQGEIKCYWSELLGLYIMPVYHVGTSWRIVDIELELPDGSAKAYVEKLEKKGDE